MTRWFAEHAFALRRAVARLAQTPVASILGILVIGVALALPLGFYAMLVNLERLAGRLPTDAQLTVFLATDATAADAAAIEARLKRDPRIARFEFVPKDKALAELKAAAALTDVIAGLPGNPLPDAFVVLPKPAAPAAADKLRDEAKLWPKVEHVQFDSAWSRRLHAGTRLARTIAALLGGALAFALVAVAFNTIRLQILTQHDEIEVSSLIGATRPFIRRPFLYFGALQGFAGGAVALALVFGALAIINGQLLELARLYTTDLRLLPPDPADSASLLAFATGLGLLGAWLSVSRNLVRHSMG